MKLTKLIATMLLLSIAAGHSEAHNGPGSGAGSHGAYYIHLTMPDVEDSMVYLAHFYGKGGNEIYIADSARFKKGVAEFHGKDSTFVGGSYMMLLSNKKTNFEFLINRGEELYISASVKKLPEGIKFVNSPQNDKFLQYEEHAKENAEAQQQLVKDLQSAKTKDDTAEIRKKSLEMSKNFVDFRRQLIKESPNTLLANILNALEKPEVPEGEHFLPDGKTKDSTFAYRYYKTHFWDGFDFRDDRLIYTPLYDGMLDEYFSKEVLPYPDSVIYEADILLKKTAGTKDMFKYTLWWITRYVENSKVMGLSDVFVYLVENYYMKGDAYWLNNDELQKYIARVQKMAPNVIGNIAPELKLPNVITKEDVSMHDVKAKYTLVVFYSPNCGHCQHELPLLDSAYEASLKDKGVKIYTVATEGDAKAISDFLVKLKVDTKWINTWDPENVGNYHNNYDVYSTPTIYLLDERKLIVGKRLDHTNIGSLIDMHERKLKEKAKGK